MGITEIGDQRLIWAYHLRRNDDLRSRDRQDVIVDGAWDILEEAVELLRERGGITIVPTIGMARFSGAFLFRHVSLSLSLPLLEQAAGYTDRASDKLDMNQGDLVIRPHMNRVLLFAGMRHKMAAGRRI